MTRIRSKKTNLEVEFVSLLKSKTDKKFTRNDLSIKGKPDIVFKKEKICVFLDSDFWHGWQYPRWKHLLKNDFWREKIEGNRKRDRKTTAYLRRNGWFVFRFWEHSLRDNREQFLVDVKKRLLREKVDDVPKLG